MATKYRLPVSPAGLVDNIDAFDDLAEDIANPPANRPLRGAIGRSGRLFCDLYGASPQPVKDLLGPGFAATGLLCQPYWDNRGFTPPAPAGGFTGGQCSALYTVNLDVADYRYRRVNCASGVVEFIGAPQSFGLANVQGPIQRVYAKVTANGNCGPITYVLAIVDANGTERLGGTFATTTAIRRIDLLKFSPRVVRSDGLPDTCGDKAGDMEPGPTPPPTPTFPPGEEPGVEPDGQPFIIVPPVDNPVVGGEPTEVPEDGGDGEGGGPTEPPVSGDEEPGSGGDDEFPPPEPGTRWVGVCIRLTTLPLGTGTVPGTAPETILTQVVGNARLLFDSETGSSYDTPVQIRSAGLCLWEPVKGLSPKGVRVNLKPGFEYNYTPYFVAEDA